MTIKVGGGGGAPKLAPDLTYPSDLVSGVQYIQITVPVTAGVKTTTLSLSGGAFLVSGLKYTGLANESMTFDLTVDGVPIWSATKTVAGASQLLFGGGFQTTTDTGPTNEVFQCTESVLLEITTTTDTSVFLNYIARPIL